MAVIIPLWVSYLVRAYAWKIILGQTGILNGLLQAAGPDRPAAHVPAVQPLGRDPGADPHLHAVHPDADLRRARGDPAGAQGGEPGPLRQPLADLSPDRAAALAARRDGGLHLRLRAQHGRLPRAPAPRRQRQRAHGLEPGLEPVRRGLQLAARRRGVGRRAAADAVSAVAGQSGGDGDELWRTGESGGRAGRWPCSPRRRRQRPRRPPTGRPPDRPTARDRPPRPPDRPPVARRRGWSSPSSTCRWWW